MPSAHGTGVQEFYRGSELFLTGATGFLGKLVIEKLLRCCPGVTKVYALIRPKKGLSAEQRKKDLLDNLVFDRMKSEQPGSVEKIVFVPGDCSSPRLGLSDSDYHDLTQHVNILLHLAATVRFDEKLKRAVNVNAMGAREVISLCRNCVNLKAAVFVSTAFSNCAHKVIKEEFYDTPMTIEDITCILNTFTDNELNVMCQKIIQPWPNTYVFSKAIYENVIQTEGKDLPVAVVRPSIVVNTLKEPSVAWVDNMYGPISLAIGGGCGILRVYYSSGEELLDMVPADLVANCIIASAMSAQTRSQDVIPVYNLTSSENPVTVRRYVMLLREAIEEFPLKTSIWYPYSILTGNFYVFKFLAFFLHFLPGVLLDFILRLRGKPQILLRIYRKIHTHLMFTSYFSTQSWVFVCKNTSKLYESLSHHDRQLFPFDPKLINWKEFLKDCGIETRKYLLNESLDGLEGARKRHKRFYIAHTLMKIVFWIAVIYVSMKLLNIPIWDSNFGVKLYGDGLA